MALNLVNQQRRPLQGWVQHVLISLTISVVLGGIMSWNFTFSHLIIIHILIYSHI